jgi:hypothetical protein
MFILFDNNLNIKIIASAVNTRVVLLLFAGLLPVVITAFARETQTWILGLL